jgi:parallel beta-helix repeat protein
MRHQLVAAVAACSLVMAFAGAPGAVRAQGPAFYVNTTEDFLPIKGTYCIPGETCTFRAAVERAQSAGGTVRACYEDTHCPANIKPLTTTDPHYDAATKRWALQFNDSTFLGYLLEVDDLKVDFTLDVPDWRGPQDNRIVLDSGTTRLPNTVIVINAAGVKLAGFELRGQAQVAMVVLRDGAVDNQIGPGMVFAGIKQGVTILMRGAAVTRNRVVGSWCGITGDGTVMDPVQDDCVVLDEGANNNTVGGPQPGDRNVIAASEVGNGVAFGGDATRNNLIQGNYIGTDPTGTHAMGLASGVAIFRQASDNKVIGNVLSGNRGAGVFSVDASTPFGRTQTLVEGNFIGTDPTGDIAVPNNGFGVRIEGQSRDVKVYRNRVRYNRAGGILVCGSKTENNTIAENSVTDNKVAAVQVCAGANGGVKEPVITRTAPGQAAGTACPGCRVELFSDPASQADTFEAAADADADGNWAIDKPAGFAYRSLTATATDGKSTSGLSKPMVVAIASPTPTETPAVTPTVPVTPSEPPVTETPPIGGIDIYLPWLGRAAGR